MKWQEVYTAQYVRCHRSRYRLFHIVHIYIYKNYIILCLIVHVTTVCVSVCVMCVRESEKDVQNGRSYMRENNLLWVEKRMWAVRR